MHTVSDIHLQFANAFEDHRIRPFAYLLSKRMQEGHICMPVAAVAEAGEEIPFVMNTIPDPANMPHLVSGPHENETPFIVDEDNIYFQRYHRYETSIIRSILEKISKGNHMKDQRQQELLGQKQLIHGLAADYDLTGLEEMEKTDWQLAASLQALLNDFSIITGGPGTGKTTTLAKLLLILYAIQPDARVALAAPTGKASMRMHESLQKSADFLPALKAYVDKLKPSTLHHLLGYQKETVHFKFNRKNPLPFDWVVVDEASMIDVPMFAKLMEALGDNGRIVLLGDRNQLASVEAGSLLGDLCNGVAQVNAIAEERRLWLNSFIPDANRQIGASMSVSQPEELSHHIMELKLSHRFKKTGAIGAISSAIIGSQVDTVKQMMDDAPQSGLLFDNGTGDEVLENFILGYADYIRENDVATALQRLNDLRVLVTVREGPQGLYAINRKIEMMLRNKGMLAPDQGNYEHRPIMVTRNNYELDLFNGDIGILRTDAKGQLRAWFDKGNGEVRSVLPAYLSHIETVFAMTIHKSQGSEFDRVMVILPEGTDNPLLTRELLYTGVTRARKEVIIRGSQETILHAIAKSVQRISGVNKRLAKLQKP